MLKLLKLNCINIILCLNVAAELNAKLTTSTISNSHSQDTNAINNTIKGIPAIYNGNSYDNNKNNSLIYAEPTKPSLSAATTGAATTQRTLEDTIVPASDIDITTPYMSARLAWDTEEKLLENSLKKLKSEREDNSCIMDNIKTALLWWCHSNGTLRETNLNVWAGEQQIDLSYRYMTRDEDLLALSKVLNQKNDAIILAFSAAYNNLSAAPYSTLENMAANLNYLSLKGNPFVGLNQSEITDHNSCCNLNANQFNYLENKSYKRMFSKSKENIAWATFPLMPALIELDISNCNIEYITKKVFQNLTNLKNLYIGHNKILIIPSDVFYYLPQLQVLDLSFTNIYDSFMDQLVSSPTLESVMKLIYGVSLQQNVFKYLPNLVYLDLSHTKLTRSSAVAFTYLGPSLKYMSLCYTSFPVFGNGLFKNTSLVGLDISGNNLASFSITEDVFEGMPDSLLYLYFERSNLKDLAWLKHLSNLRFLALAGNNINTLSVENFKNLKQLQALDLSSNQVGNWYSRVFSNNKNLSILSLRDNNINIITSEMLKDLNSLVYLSLGDNNFICDCLLKDLVEIAAANNQKALCKGSSLWLALRDKLHLNITYMTMLLEGSRLYFNTSLDTLDISSMLWSQNMQKLRRTLNTMTRSYSWRAKPKLRYILNAFRSLNKTKNCHNLSDSEGIDERLNSSLLKLQLLDYEEEHYWCYNETERQHLMRLNCQRKSMVQNIVQELDSLTTYVWATLGGIILFVALGIVIYWKRWHIYYYYSSLKSAALLSSVSQNHMDNFNILCADHPNMIYDIFISYCQSDRDWIVHELMPNVEEAGDISICLHERDFQVGVTILENIVSCMERSKALMLIISSNFLLSHWCQFEMHMAQHRVLDLKPDHLIVILLEDIPRSKRPTNLQYLMEVNTYIKWPGAKGKKSVHPEERKLFWKRIKRALVQIGLNPLESMA